VRLILATMLIVSLIACTDSDPQVSTSISASALTDQINQHAAPLILDVRTPREFDAGHVPGAINIPHDTLAQRLDELNASKSDEIVVYCHSGRRAGIAEDVLATAGYSHVVDLEGHWKDWTGATD
jgi:phage shock protein E